MSISLTQPSIGSTSWGSALNTNWQTIEDAINRSGADTADPTICEGRLSLTTGVPVTTADVTGSTLYFTPFRGNRLALYDGTRWVVLTFSELTLTTSDISNGSSGSADTNYDIFAYNNNGAVAIEGLAWSNDTTRATALTRQNGVLVKSGTATRRYIGTIRLNSTPQFADTEIKRFVWNYCNRLSRRMCILEPSSSWTYSTGSWQAANGSTINRVEFVIGVSEDAVEAFVSVGLEHDSTDNTSSGVGLALDGTSFTSADIYCGYAHTLMTQIEAYYVGLVGDGYHYLQWVEAGGGATTTWYGATLDIQSGVLGVVLG